MTTDALAFVQSNIVFFIRLLETTYIANRTQTKTFYKMGERVQRCRWQGGGAARAAAAVRAAAARAAAARAAAVRTAVAWEAARVAMVRVEEAREA